MSKTIAPDEEDQINAGITADRDNVELSTQQIGQLRPASEILPDVVAAYQTGELKRSVGQRGIQKASTKQAISVRYSREVIEYFRATGKGWQTRMDDVLREYVEQHS
ncbi:MAG: hypothetical protein ACI8WB_004901 [Phenylobacterium sp.]|jgi:uncharacterized protein (DUF4415 family)